MSKCCIVVHTLIRVLVVGDEKKDGVEAKTQQKDEGVGEKEADGGWEEGEGEQEAEGSLEEGEGEGEEDEASSPMFVPTKGLYFQHDNRYTEENDEQEKR